MGLVAGPTELFTVNAANGEYRHAVCADHCLPVGGHSGIASAGVERRGNAVYLVFSWNAAIGAAIFVLLRLTPTD